MDILDQQSVLFPAGGNADGGVGQRNLKGTPACFPVVDNWYYQYIRVRKMALTFSNQLSFKGKA